MATQFIKEIKFRNRFILPTAIVLAVLTVGTIGYWLFWRDIGGTMLDGFFMAFTTITTIGYGEVKPLNTYSRIFTIFVAVIGIGSLFYTLGIAMEYIVVTQLGTDREQKKMQHDINKMTGHIIVVGLGRVGRLATTQLQQSKENIIAIDHEENRLRSIAEMGIPYVIGDATLDAVLRKAGIERARGLIAATGHDATNVFIVLSARVLNPDIFIVARAEDETSIDKLKRAGADKAVDPFEIGGQRLANLMVHPLSVDFFETTMRLSEQDLSIEFVNVTPESPIAGKSLRDMDLRRVSGASILAVIRDGKAYVNPESEYIVIANDQLVAFGTKDQLQRLEGLTQIT